VRCREPATRRRTEDSYGGINAVKGIDLRQAGEMVALIGANARADHHPESDLRILMPVAGKILQRREVTGTPSFSLVEQGLALVPEGRGVFGRLTVEENLRMGAYTRRDRRAVQRDLERVYELFARLRERRRQTGGTLSGGEQQMLAIGRALMSSPRLLLLDEPSMGLAPLMVQRIFETIRRVAAEGVTVLLVEQNAKLALEASARGYVMESGLITLTDAAPALLGNPQVRQAYLGE
jgi:branched-chain amino acid transport system ATP-binding protein